MTGMRLGRIMLTQLSINCRIRHYSFCNFSCYSTVMLVLISYARTQSNT